MFQQINSYQEVTAYTLLFGQLEARRQYDLTGEQLNEILRETDFTQLGMLQSIKKLVLDLSKKVNHTQPTIAKFTGVPAFMVSKIIEQNVNLPNNLIEENNKGQEQKKSLKNKINTSQNQERTRKINQNLSDILKSQQEENENEDVQVDVFKNLDINESEENQSKKKLKCSFCDSGFKTKKMLKEHIKQTHKKAKRDGQFFYCDQCNKKLKTQRKLNNHMKSKHNIENQLEGEKEKAVKAENQINEEDQSAQSEAKKKKIFKQKKNFPCDYCNKIFFHSYYRYNHIKDIHDGKIRGKTPIKPEEEEKFVLKCDACDFLAEDENQYESHKQMHSLNQEGKQSTMFNGNLKCVKCERVCYSIDELKNHIIDYHKDVTFEKLYDIQGIPLNQFQYISCYLYCYLVINPSFARLLFTFILANLNIYKSFDALGPLL